MAIAVRSSTTKVYLGLYATTELWSLLLVPILIATLICFARRTRRASVVLGFPCLMMVVGWDMLLLGTFMFAQGTLAGAGPTRWVLYGAFASHLLLILFLEWRVMPGAWARGVARKRFDLKEGRLNLHIIRFGYRHNPDAGLFPVSLIALPGSLLFTYMGWCWGLEPLRRLLIWELRTGRVISSGDSMRNSEK